MTMLGLGAGVLKQTSHFTRSLLASSAAFLTLGSLTLQSRPGNPEPVLDIDPETGVGRNAVGLKNPGISDVMPTIPEICGLLEEAPNQKGLWVNLAPTGRGTLKQMLEISTALTDMSLVDVWEINGACPNHRDGTTLHDVLAKDPTAVEELLQETVGYRIPAERLAFKIAPDTDEEMLDRIIVLCLKYRVGRIVSGNTRRIQTPNGPDGKQLISVPHCGLSGPPLLDAGLRQMEILAELNHQHGSFLDLTYCGGITTGADFDKAICAGANDVQVVTAYLAGSPRIFQEIYLASNAIR